MLQMSLCYLSIINYINIITFCYIDITLSYANVICNDNVHTIHCPNVITLCYLNIIVTLCNYTISFNTNVSSLHYCKCYVTLCNYVNVLMLS